MSDMYVPEHGWELHMSWCGGTHAQDGHCQIEVGVEDVDASARLWLIGEHCDHQRLCLAGDVTTVEGVDVLLHLLGRLRTDLAAGLADVDCDHHPDLHPDDEE